LQGYDEIVTSLKNVPIGRRLRMIREHRGLTQAELAAAIGQTDDLLLLGERSRAPISRPAIC